jgi:hypothetical protein
MGEQVLAATPMQEGILHGYSAALTDASPLFKGDVCNQMCRFGAHRIAAAVLPSAAPQLRGSAGADPEADHCQLLAMTMDRLAW